MASSKRWNDYSSDDEDAEKILPPGILSRSIGGVNSEAHDALHNVRACLDFSIGVWNTVALNKAFT